MKKSLVGKTRDGGKLFFVSGGRSTGIFQIGRTMTEINFWDFVDKRPDLEEMMITPMQKRLWSRNISDPQWVAQFMPAHWRKREDENPYNQKVSQALDTIRTTTDLLF